MLLSETAESIKKMEIRGAGRIARAAVEALADYARNLDVCDPEIFKREMQRAAATLTDTRPTAVSLPNAVRYVMRALDSFESVPAARDAVLARAAEFIDHSEHAVEWIAEIGARHISDGDVLLHAVIDALLGAAALGDIGSHFPPSDERWRGADSRELARRAAFLVREAGYEPGNLDCTVVLERPRLGPHREAILASLAETLGMPPSSISFKAKTSEGVDAAGEGRAVEARAVVLLSRRD